MGSIVSQVSLFGVARTIHAPQCNLRKNHGWCGISPESVWMSVCVWDAVTAKLISGWMCFWIKDVVLHISNSLALFVWELNIAPLLLLPFVQKLGNYMSAAANGFFQRENCSIMDSHNRRLMAVVARSERTTVAAFSIHFQALCHFQGSYGHKHLLLHLKSTHF